MAASHLIALPQAQSRLHVFRLPQRASPRPRCINPNYVSHSVKAAASQVDADVSRRAAIVTLTAAASLLTKNTATALPIRLPDADTTDIKLCTADCEASLDDIPTVTTSTGLAYKDIVVGTGPSPPVGFQVAAHYVAMVPNGKIFDSSLEKGMPYIFRVGSGQVISGLDQGILSMKVGGTRRLYIPGSLAFAKGLNSAPGRPRVAPSSPVVFDVSLLYIPGLENDEDEE